MKLAFGSLTEQRPRGLILFAWIAETLPDAFADWRCEVVELDLHRAFWEKVTILHAEYHRPVDKATPDRFARQLDSFQQAAEDSGFLRLLNLDAG